MRSLDVIRDVAWIEAVDMSNTVRSVTPWEVLTCPQQWRAIQYANAMHTVVAYRFMTALWLAAYRCGDTIDAYVDRYQDRWWLCHDQYPFGQQPLLAETLDATNEPNSVFNSIDVTYDKGSPLLWRHETSTDQVSITAAEAVLLVLSVQATSPAGLGKAAIYNGRKATYRSNPTGPVAGRASTIPYSRDLRDVFNSIAGHYAVAQGDTALWERRDDIVTSKETRTPTGTLEWLTWPTRQVLLRHGADGIVIGAVGTPGWVPSIDTERQLLIDPFAVRHPGKQKDLLGATDINNYTAEVRLPSWIDSLRTPDSGVSVSVIGQSRKLAKVVGDKHRRRWLPRADVPPVHEPLPQEELCQPQLF